ncbi:flagellin [Paracoccus sp. S3-43]|uniref:flagellin N-terminal helical domain-containing protein n=1 Tax=Paracoccus sp. S3-43 TaxID=3030011 RepID=UPI0023AF2722|nr:flagellin [Paracoccus sp. S3-43]WEF24330.1 flagellin [Paracoccus sp. S3-43]
MSSILTNNGAIVALQTLKNVNSSLNKAQSEISTGKSINSAKDNSAVWAISKVMEADQSSAKAIQSSLNVAGATVQTAVDGADLIAKTLTEMKDLASRAGTDGYEFAKVQADIAAKTAVITATIAGTQMNGVNLLKTNGVNAGATYTVLSSLDRSNTGVTAGNIAVASVDFEATLLAGTNALTAITDRASAEAAVLALEANLQTALNGSAALGAKAKQIEEQSNFIGKLADSLKAGVGSLVDADMEEASARLQALQTQQQLGIQALSIANQAPSAILSLFR